MVNSLTVTAVGLLKTAKKEQFAWKYVVESENDRCTIK